MATGPRGGIDARRANAGSVETVLVADSLSRKNASGNAEGGDVACVGSRTVATTPVGADLRFGLVTKFEGEWRGPIRGDSWCKREHDD